MSQFAENKQEFLTAQSVRHTLCFELVMNISELFPQKLALCQNFCNRQKEQKHLSENIDGVRPTLIISPRRYGKTSLGIHVIKKLNVSYSHLDLFPLMNIEEVEDAVLNGIAEIIAATEKTLDKAMKAVSQFFSELDISFTIVNSKIQVRLGAAANSPTRTLSTALLNLDDTLRKKKTKAVLFLDEFQRLEQLDNLVRVEGVLRNVAQKSTNLVFLFSGSNRYLLNKMFDDSSRPFFKLCDKISLKRISTEDHVKFIEKKMTSLLKNKIDIDAIYTILAITENHTYYVNILCSRLIRYHQSLTISNIEKCWYEYAVEEKSAVFKELEGLSNNQFKLLTALSRYGATSTPTSDDFLSFSSIAMSSVRQSLKVLIEKDYIYVDDEKKYRTLDPLIKYILIRRPD